MSRSELNSRTLSLRCVTLWHSILSTLLSSVSYVFVFLARWTFTERISKCCVPVFSVVVFRVLCSGLRGHINRHPMWSRSDSLHHFSILGPSRLAQMFSRPWSWSADIAHLDFRCSWKIAECMRGNVRLSRVCRSNDLRWSTEREWHNATLLDRQLHLPRLVSSLSCVMV